MPKVVIDTVSLQHLLRPPKRSGKALPETALDDHLLSGAIQLALDRSRGLLSEWERTCGTEVIAVVINRWERGIVFIATVKTLSPSVNKRLRQLGFKDPIDRLVLRIACTCDKIAVSNDSDFWDPRDSRSLGNYNAPVARYMREELGVQVLLLAGLLNQLRKRSK